MAALVDIIAGFAIGGVIALAIIYFLIKRGDQKETPDEQMDENEIDAGEEPILDKSPGKRLPPKNEMPLVEYENQAAMAEQQMEVLKPANETMRKMPPIEGREATVEDILASPRAFEGVRVVIRACDVVPGMRIMGVYTHIISDNTGKVDGFSKDMMEGHGDIGGTVKLTSTGSPYIEF